jgi:mannose-1-phosphate guanylyltransferase / mannose-6-phosphate isomerase
LLFCDHWIFVSHFFADARGAGNEAKRFAKNDSNYPIGSRHRLENPSKIDLELIEVQTGSYLGEDDIVRIEDDYRRS